MRVISSEAWQNHTPKNPISDFKKSVCERGQTLSSYPRQTTSSPALRHASLDLSGSVAHVATEEHHDSLRFAGV